MEWEFYLHKVFNMDFDEWRASRLVHATDNNPRVVEATINKSKSMLDNFNPS